MGAANVTERGMKAFVTFGSETENDRALVQKRVSRDDAIVLNHGTRSMSAEERN